MNELVRSAALRHLDTPTVIRRAFAAPSYADLGRWEHAFILFVSRVTSGELFWR